MAITTQAAQNAGTHDLCNAGKHDVGDCAAGCPCASPGNGGTVTLTVTGGMFCLGSGSGAWTYSGTGCQWTLLSVGGGITVTYDEPTNQWHVVCVGVFLFTGFDIYVPATCDGTGTYPVFSSSGVSGTCSWTITSA